MMNFSESGFVLVKIKCLLELCKRILKILSTLSAKLIKLQDSAQFFVVNLILIYVTVDWVVVLRFFTFYSTLFQYLGYWPLSIHSSMWNSCNLHFTLLVNWTLFCSHTSFPLCSIWQSWIRSYFALNFRPICLEFLSSTFFIIIKSNDKLLILKIVPIEFNYFPMDF